MPDRARNAATPASRSRGWLAILTVVLLPRGTAGRVQNVRPLTAWLIHVLGGCLLLLVVFWLIVLSESYPIHGIGDMGNAATMLAHDLASEKEQIERELGPLPLVAMCSIFGVEIALALLACVVAAWGAREEPIRASFRSALCRTWLVFAGVWLPVLLAGWAGVRLDEVQSQWHRSAPSLGAGPPIAMPVPPSIPSTDPDYAKAMADYQQALTAYQASATPTAAQWQAWQAWYDSQPWYIRHKEALIALLCFVAGAWFFWSWLRAVGAPREVAAVPRDPMCETCGYNLTTLPLEGRCPECGEPVAGSLGADVRPGTPWDLRPRFLSRATTVRECSPSRSALPSLPVLPSRARKEASPSNRPESLPDGRGLVPEALPDSRGSCPEALPDGRGSESRHGVASHPALPDGRGSVQDTAFHPRSLAWGRCFASAMAAPARFGRAMRAAPVTPHYRTFLAWNLPLVFLIGPVSLPLSVMLIAGIGELVGELDMFLLVGSMFGLCCVVGAVLVSCLGALLVGGLMGHHQGRNLLPVAMQMACYLSGFLVCWEIIGAAVSIGMIALGEGGFFRAVQTATGIWEPHLILFCWLAPNLACAALYLVLLTRGTAAARYANR